MARRDLKALHGMSDSGIFAAEIFGFHAQQAVEKAVKAWLSLLGVNIPRTHDLDGLFALVQERGEIVPSEFESLVDLSDFAVQYRYEAFPDLEGELDRLDITERIDRLLRHVETRLSDFSTP
jgi:HEPN domain-containing protein